MRQNNRSGYWFRERQTKKSGTVIDVYFYIVGADGREKQKCIGGFENKTLAKKAYFDFMHTYVAPPKKVAYKQKYTLFEEAFKQYLAFCNISMDDGTYIQIDGFYRNHYAQEFDGKCIEKITSQDIYLWQDHLIGKISEKTEKLYADKTINNCVSRLSTFFEWANTRLGVDNPLRDIAPPKKRMQKKEMLIWEEFEFESFIQNINDIRWKTVFMALYYSGCRIGELLALQENDYLKQSFSINKSLSKKNKLKLPYIIKTTKNKKSRNVPLPKKLTTQIDIYLQWKNNNISHKFLFVGDNGDYLPHSTIIRAFRLYTNIAKLKIIRIHDIRHSYVSLLIHKGVNLAVIANLIGDTLEQVTKTYGHMYITDKAKVVELLD